MKVSSSISDSTITVEPHSMEEVVCICSTELQLALKDNYTVHAYAEYKRSNKKSPRGARKFLLPPGLAIGHWISTWPKTC
jgi:hypothetical protein